MTDIITCELCGCPIHRTPEGTLAQGLAGHFATCHPHEDVP